MFGFQRLIQKVKGDFWDIKISSEAGIRDFVLNPPCQEILNGQTRRLAGDWNPDANRNTLLSSAKSNLEKHFSVVGLTEKFDETLILLGRVLGWSQWNFSYARNTNPRRIQRCELPSCDLEAILETNNLDMSCTTLHRDFLSLP